MSLALDILSWLLILAGSGFLVAGGIGLVRLPDIYTRLHASGLIDTLGLGLVIVGLMVQAGLTLITVKLALIIVFVFFTSPSATYAVAHAARVGGLKPVIAPDGDGADEGPGGASSKS